MQSEPLEPINAEHQRRTPPRLTTQVVRRSGYLVREGDSSDECLILINGLALRNRLVSRGERQILGLCVPGDFVDLETLVFAHADHTVQAVSSCTVASVPRDKLKYHAEVDHCVATELMRRAMIETSIAREWQANIGRRTSTARLAHLICELRYRLIDGEPEDGERFALPLSQIEMADVLGLTAVHVNRVLRELEVAGLIGRDKREFVIPDWSKMRRAADFNPRYLYRDRPPQLGTLELIERTTAPRSETVPFGPS